MTRSKLLGAALGVSLIFGASGTALAQEQQPLPPMTEEPVSVEGVDDVEIVTAEETFELTDTDSSTSLSNENPTEADDSANGGNQPNSPNDSGI